MSPKKGQCQKERLVFQLSLFFSEHDMLVLRGRKTTNLRSPIFQANFCLFSAGYIHPQSMKLMRKSLTNPDHFERPPKLAPKAVEWNQLSKQVFHDTALEKLMNIRCSPVEVGSLSHYFQGFYTSQVIVWISSINSIPLKIDGWKMTWSFLNMISFQGTLVKCFGRGIWKSFLPPNVPHLEMGLPKLGGVL